MRTSYQRGFVAGQQWALAFVAKALPVESEIRKGIEGLSPVAGVAGLVGKSMGGQDIPANDYDEWAEEELRHERLRITEALEAALYLAPRHEDEETAARRAFERIPEHLQEGLERYLDEHIPAGHFLMAVLTNDLHEALGRADLKSRAGLFEISVYLHNYAPAPAWGSKRAVEFWLKPPIPIMDIGRPEGTHPKALGAELDISREGLTACPQCGGRHPVHHAKAEPGCVTLPGEGPTKQEHHVQYVWCQRVHLVVVGIDGREIER